MTLEPWKLMGPGSWIVTDTKRAKCIAVIGDPADGLTGEDRENARLFLAARELLAACELLLAVYAPLSFPDEVTDAFSSAVIKARDALAKAKGT